MNQIGNPKIAVLIGLPARHLLSFFAAFLNPNPGYPDLRIFNWLSIGILNMTVNHAFRDKHDSDGSGLRADCYRIAPPDTGFVFFLLEESRLSRVDHDLPFRHGFEMEAAVHSSKHGLLCRSDRKSVV